VFEFLVDTYRTERLKTLSVWSQVPDARMTYRAEPRARTPLEHMVHQCMSEDAWMRNMLGVAISLPPLPARETRLDFLNHYAACSTERLTALEAKADVWFLESTQFFDVVRTRAWVLTRRFAHSAHHRGQLTAYLRLLGMSLYSTYGPTADTGGLAPNGAKVVYRYASISALVAGESAGVATPPLPGVGTVPPTERPGSDANVGGVGVLAKGLTPILNVSDMVESFAWFERLGWKKQWEWGTPPTFGAVCSGTCEIFLCLDGQGGRGKSALPTTAGVGEAADQGVWMSVWVDDVDAIHRHCLEQGVEVTWPPTDEPWNVREMHVRHPDGHVFRISKGIGGNE
jgi:uncharacterized damage-inducible protein DinB